MYIRTGGPAEPEEADGNAEAAHERGRQAFFGFEFAVGVELWLGVAMEIPEERGAA